jgi:hypothetical protein
MTVMIEMMIDEVAVVMSVVLKSATGGVMIDAVMTGTGEESVDAHAREEVEEVVVEAVPGLPAAMGILE